MRLSSSLLAFAVLSIAPHLAGCDFGCNALGCPPLAASLDIRRPDGARIEADTVVVGIDGQDVECQIPDTPDDDYATIACRGTISVTRGRAERCVEDENGTSCDGSGPPNVRVEFSEPVAALVVLKFQRAGETLATQAFPPRYEELGSCAPCHLWEEEVELDA